MHGYKGINFEVFESKVSCCEARIFCAKKKHKKESLRI